MKATEAAGMIVLSVACILGWEIYDRKKSSEERARVSATTKVESLFATLLNDYGRKVAASGEPGVFKYAHVQQTMSGPFVSYVVKFSTSDISFRSEPAAATDHKAFLTNTGRRIVWEAKFCTQELREMMHLYKVNLVNGNLTDDAGETQFIASCLRN